MKSKDENAERDDAIQALGELFSKPTGKGSSYHRYVLVQLASGELVFEQEEFDFYFEQAIANAFGQPKPRRRIIATNLPTGKQKRPQTFDQSWICYPPGSCAEL
jgi:hypothetical protein